MAFVCREGWGEGTAEGQKASLSQAPWPVAQQWECVKQKIFSYHTFAGWKWVQGTAEGQKASLGQVPWPIAQLWENAKQKTFSCLSTAGREWVQSSAEGQHASLGRARSWSTS